MSTNKSTTTVRTTSKEVVLPKGSELRDHIVKRFVERFWDDEMVEMMNNRDMKAFHENWNKKVVNNPEGVISVSEYMEWIDLIRVLLPKRYSKKKFDLEIRVADFVYGPMSYEAAKERKESLPE